MQEMSAEIFSTTFQLSFSSEGCTSDGKGVIVAGDKEDTG